MNYIVGENVFTFNSGTEFSQFERLRALNKSGMTTKLITRNYNRFATRDMKAHNIDSKMVINMYDYFQGVSNVPNKKQNLRYLSSMPLDYYHIVGVDNNLTNINLDGKNKGAINVMPGTVGVVGDIDYKDSLGQSAVREYFDWRGFCSMVETYHPNGEIAHQQYLNSDGVPAIEIVFMYINKEVRPTMWKLLDYMGKDYQFDTENQLFTFFLNEINKRDQGTYISDRRSLDDIVLKVNSPKAIYAYLHSAPYTNPKHPKKSDILPAYNIALGLDKNIDNRFDKVICPTEEQINDLKVICNGVDFACTPDSYVEVKSESKIIEKENILVYVGRLSEEKNISDLIKCFDFLNKKRNDVKLVLQGYFSSESYKNKIKKLVSSLKIETKVTFTEYTPDLNPVYEHATMFLNTSFSEGFGMNMLESMAYGVPVASFANVYSKNNLIQNDFNGIVINNRSALILSNKINDILNDPDGYHQLSLGAVKTANYFSENHFIEAWEKIL